MTHRWRETVRSADNRPHLAEFSDYRAKTVDTVLGPVVGERRLVA